ncbi:methionine--tRNA ligase [Candidatus Pacearchaeota archaeon]|nr:methionine--tRNA ligase [Candidatus Pacearchaeota archaeon]
MVNKKTKNQKILITAALPYINNVPHLGHIAGSHLPADIFARYCRSKGYETLFVGGTDESGSPSEIAAEEIGISLDVFSKKLYEIHAEIYKWFNISYDNFSRTSKSIHHKTTQEFFKAIYDNKYIKEGVMNVFYSPTEKRFLSDRYVRGQCPKCGFEGASGDQCEKCTSVHDPTELKNPKSSITGNAVEIRSAKHLFLRLDQLEPKLKKWIAKQKSWRTQVRSIAQGWIKEGLHERSITRDLKNGVSVPLKGYEDKVLYVWFDAPIGYVSSTKELLPNGWKSFWKGKDVQIFHFLGKDNIPFHTIFWPATIMASGGIVNLPNHVAGYQYLNYEGGKFSKSKKRGIFCEKLPETGIDSDIIRAYITFVLPETSDSEFKWEDFKNRINADLIGNFGNFINRTLKFVNGKLGGEVIKPNENEFTKNDKELMKKVNTGVQKITDYLEAAEIKKAFSEAFALSAQGNKYFDDCKPWVLVREDEEKTKKILYNCVNLCRTLAIIFSPFVPNAAKNVWKQIGLKGNVDDPKNWDTAKDYEIPKKHKIGNPEALFKRLDDDYLDNFKEITANAPDLKQLFK